MLANTNAAERQLARPDGKRPLPQPRRVPRRRQLNQPDFGSVSCKAPRVRATLPEYMSGIVLARLRRLWLGFISFTADRGGGRFLPCEALVVHCQPNQGDRDISRRSGEGHGAEVTRPPHVMRVGRGRLLC